MSEDYKKGYRDGFKDGYEQAKKEHVWLTPTMPYQGDMMKCPVCGKSGVHTSVCHHPQCPSRVTTITSAIGAAGSDTLNNYPLGANGPAGGDIQ